MTDCEICVQNRVHRLLPPPQLRFRRCWPPVVRLSTACVQSRDTTSCATVKFALAPVLALITADSSVPIVGPCCLTKRTLISSGRFGLDQHIRNVDRSHFWRPQCVGVEIFSHSLVQSDAEDRAYENENGFETRTPLFSILRWCDFHQLQRNRCLLPWWGYASRKVGKFTA